jgi:uncharacterized radical SAM superfamily Fe-S cluster-containing enzyme
MESWRGDAPALGADADLPCPGGCGLCEDHAQETCCVLLEVTGRCNLRCEYCLAGECASPDPPLDTVKNWLGDLARSGRTFLQLSGGEPTVRDDLPEIASHAKSVGFEYVQLNTNGLRIAKDASYARALARSGVSFVFLQFDGTTDDAYMSMRGAPLYKIKRKAIDNCDRCGLGVTLVSTVVPGVNDHDIGGLISLAVSLSPAVRGVHFHPVSYFGRYPKQPDDSMRMTLPELLLKIELQTGGMITREYLFPSHCDHPMCGFHGDFVVMPDGLRPLAGKGAEAEESCCSRPRSAAEKSRRFVGRRWRRRGKPGACCGSGAPDLESFDGFLDRVHSHGFTITAMAFQDCLNIDLERLRRCSLHAYVDGKVIPLCVRYLTPQRA